MQTSIAALQPIENMYVAPEVQLAMASIDLPEVQEMIRRLGAFNLAVCVPHMHSENTDFAALPHNVVQVEENFHVRWIAHEQSVDIKGAVPVAWRWIDDGIQAAAKCIAICSPNAKKGHQKYHL